MSVQVGGFKLFIIYMLIIWLICVFQIQKENTSLKEEYQPKREYLLYLVNLWELQFIFLLFQDMCCCLSVWIWVMYVIFNFSTLEWICALHSGFLLFQIWKLLFLWNHLSAENESNKIQTFNPINGFYWILVNPFLV